MTDQKFQPGEQVIWLKNTGEGFVFPVLATVMAVTPKRITVQADDPDERGEGIVTRHVNPANLQPRQEEARKAQGRQALSRKGSPHKEARPSPDSFEARYPNIASWVQDGWIEVGRDEGGQSFVRALDRGGLAWEGEGPYGSIDEALAALDAGIAEWLEEMS